MKNLLAKTNWEKGGELVPAVIVDARTSSVLMVGFMNRESLAKTIQTGFVWFYSRTKGRLWKKGETSGNTLRMTDIKLDCDNDALLIKVIPAGPVCHTGEASCFKEEVLGGELRELFSTIEKRKNDSPKDSYTATLFNAGLDRIALKVAEESLEVIQAATKETKKRLIEESADLFYHFFVLLAEKKASLKDIEAEIRKRKK